VSKDNETAETKHFGFTVPVDKPSEGFFIAKRQMMEVLDRSISDLRMKCNQCRKECNYAALPIIMLELDLNMQMREYVRNGMLWNSAHGK